VSWHARRAPGQAAKTTTSSTDTAARAGDLLDRDFTGPAPNRVWIADFTYVRTWAAMVYVAFVVDVDAQRIVGWHTMRTRPAELVLLPLRMAARARGQQGHPSPAASWSTTPMPGRRISRSGSPSTYSWKRSRPRSGASVTPTTTP